MKKHLKLNEIKAILNTSSSGLEPATVEKLRLARSRALEHQRTRHSVPAFAWLGNHNERDESSLMSKPSAWIVAVLFIACLISGASILHNYTTEHEINEVDVAILTDDLPIHALLD